MSIQDHIDELGKLKEFMDIYIQLTPHMIDFGGSIHRPQMPTFEDYKKTRNDHSRSLYYPHYKDSLYKNSKGELCENYCKGMGVSDGEMYRYYNYWFGKKFYTGGNIYGEYTIPNKEMKTNQNSVSIEILKSLIPDIINSLDKYPEDWNTLDVDYFPPRVERLYTKIGEYRVYLHTIHTTNEECLYHKHKWPAAFYQLSGSYEMGITYSKEEISSEEAHKLPTLSKLILNKGSFYEMTQTDCLHYVKPLSKVSHSIMITKDLYPESNTIRKESVDKKLNGLSEGRKVELIKTFLKLLR